MAERKAEERGWPSEGAGQFEEVFKRELERTARRRKVVKESRSGRSGDQDPHVPPAESATDGEGRPSAGGRGVDADFDVRSDLVGVALSAGGLRSSAFGLGVLEALHRRGVFEHVDYLSTVSGGSLIGSSLSNLMRDGGEFPFAREEDTLENRFVRWIRDRCGSMFALPPIRDLLHRGRSIFLSFLIIVPFLLVLALLLDSHFAAPVPCQITDAALGSKVWPQCDGREVKLLYFNRGILTHWERQVAAADMAEFPPRWRDRGAGERTDAAASTDKADEMKQVEAKVEKKPGNVSYLEAYRLTPLMAGLFFFYYLLHPVVIRVFKVLQHDATGGESSVGTRDAYELTFAKLAVLVGGVAALETLPILLHVFHQLRDIGVVRGVVASVAGGSLVIALTLFGRLMQQFAGFARKVIMIGVGLLGMLLPMIFVLYVAETLVWEWHALRVGDPEWKVLALFVGLVAGGALASLAAKLTGGTRLAEVAGGSLRSGLAFVLFLSGFAAPFIALAVFAGRDPEGGRHGWTVLKVILCVLLAWAASLVFEWLTAKSETLRSAKGGKIRYLLVAVFSLVVLVLCWWRLPSDPPFPRPDSIYYVVAAGVEAAQGVNPGWFVLALALVIWSFSWAALDINLTPSYLPYRDRVAGAFVVTSDSGERSGDRTALELSSPSPIDAELDLPLCGLDSPESRAPLHLINVAAVRDARAGVEDVDPFQLSAVAVGGPRTGHCPAQLMGRVFPQIDLQQATLISASDIVPIASRADSRIGDALLVLMNERLGYWLPRPGLLAEWGKGYRSVRGTQAQRFAWAVKPRKLFTEILGTMDFGDRWVYLSSGASFDPTAALALLDRRVKYIFLADAETDPTFACHGLEKLRRLALAQGITINIDTDPLMPDSNGRSRFHGVAGEILYPANEEGSAPERGRLVYLKSTRGIEESWGIAGVASRHPDFPHEESAERALSPAQFEAHRELGGQSVHSLFPAEVGAVTQTMTREALDRWVEGIQGPSPRKIFVSYRRRDNQQIHAIRHRLEEAFADDLFIDATIDKGDDYSDKIDRELASCRVFLVLIGDHWMDELGRYRDAERDWVRYEIEKVLERAHQAAHRGGISGQSDVGAKPLKKLEPIRIIPVLVGGRTPMPSPEALREAGGETLAKLAFQNAVTLDDERFESDLDYLVKILEVARQ